MNKLLVLAQEMLFDATIDIQRTRGNVKLHSNGTMVRSEVNARSFSIQKDVIANGVEFKSSR